MIIDRATLFLPDYFHILTGSYDVDATFTTNRECGTDDWQLIATLQGAARFGTGSSLFVTQPHDIVLFKPGVPHDYGATLDANHWVNIWVHFHPRPHWLEWMTWPDSGDSSGDAGQQVPMLLRPSSRTWRSVKRCLRRCHQLASGIEPHSHDLAMAALEEAILHCHNEVLRTTSPLDSRIATVIQHIQSHISEDMTVHALADVADLSPSRLSHLFHSQVGIAPMQYLDIQRIERAKQLLLNTATAIAQVAQQVGMDAVYFSIRFKQHTGVSPRQYRKSE